MVKNCPSFHRWTLPWTSRLCGINCKRFRFLFYSILVWNSWIVSTFIWKPLIWDNVCVCKIHFKWNAVSRNREGNVLSTPNLSKSVYFLFDNFCFIFSIIFFLLFILFFLFSSFYQFYRCIAYNTLDWLLYCYGIQYTTKVHLKNVFFLKSYNCLSYRAWCFYCISAEEFLLEFISVFWWSDYSSRISYHTNRMMCSTNIKHVTHVIVFNSFFYCTSR